MGVVNPIRKTMNDMSPQGKRSWFATIVKNKSLNSALRDTLKNRIIRQLAERYEETFDDPDFYLEGELVQRLAQIITKAEFLGNVIKLCIDKRGVMKNQTFITQDRVEVNFDMPLSEIVFDFYDKLKSISKGWARRKRAWAYTRRRGSTGWTSPNIHEVMIVQM